jgi:hypothetical protein
MSRQRGLHELPSVGAVRRYPYTYFWNRCGRKGQPCDVTARGKLNSCRVEFADGFKMITSRNAIRRNRQSGLSAVSEAERGNTEGKP